MPAPTKAELLESRFFIRQICAPTRPFSTPEARHNQTDPPEFQAIHFRCFPLTGFAIGTSVRRRYLPFLGR